MVSDFGLSRTTQVHKAASYAAEILAISTDHIHFILAELILLQLSQFTAKMFSQAFPQRIMPIDGLLTILNILIVHLTHADCLAYVGEHSLLEQSGGQLVGYP